MRKRVRVRISKPGASEKDMEAYVMLVVELRDVGVGLSILRGRKKANRTSSLSALSKFTSYRVARQRRPTLATLSYLIFKDDLGITNPMIIRSVLNEVDAHSSDIPQLKAYGCLLE